MGTMKVMSKVVALFLCVSAAFAQYKTESAGAPPSELAAGIRSALQQDGIKITGNGTTVAEIWLRTSMPSGTKTAEESVTLPTVPHGALLGAIRFTSKGSDRRGQGIQPGVYTLRYSMYPVNGDHQGVAPQRDFLVLSPAGTDKDEKATPAFAELMTMSRKASGTPHPAVLSLWKADTDFTPGFAKQGDTDWVLQAKIGDTPVAIILIGTASS